ncbi:MAG: LytTR family DNA-binding domain-containing protein [Gemmatimonadota bacterium]
MTIRAMIVDDEPLARRRIRELLAAAPDVEVVAECANGKEAIGAIEALLPDLLFLDIQMPQVDGFDVLATVGVGRVPVVVFVTSYDQFALRAFEAQALDYLMKPFDDERFDTALRRARARLGDRQETDVEGRLRALLDEARGHRGYLQRLAVPEGNRSVFIRVQEIDWIGAERNYIRVYASGRTHLLRESLTSIEAGLDPAMFCRIHRSTIVNIDRIQSVESTFRGEYVVVLRDRTKLPSGRSYRETLHALLRRTR